MCTPLIDGESFFTGLEVDGHVIVLNQHDTDEEKHCSRGRADDAKTQRREVYMGIVSQVLLPEDEQRKHGCNANEQSDCHRASPRTRGNSLDLHIGKFRCQVYGKLLGSGLAHNRKLCMRLGQVKFLGRLRNQNVSIGRIISHQSTIM